MSELRDFEIARAMRHINKQHGVWARYIVKYEKDEQGGLVPKRGIAITHGLSGATWYRYVGVHTMTGLWRQGAGWLAEVSKREVGSKNAS